MATRLINNLGEGGPSSCVISVGSWVVHTCISVKLFKTNILEVFPSSHIDWVQHKML